MFIAMSYNGKRSLCRVLSGVLTLHMTPHWCKAYDGAYGRCLFLRFAVHDLSVVFMLILE